MTTLEIRTVQRFSQRAIGYLWENRKDIDDGQNKIIKSIYDNKTKGQLQGSIIVNYKLSNKKAGKLGYGRLYGSIGGFEQLEKQVRGTLCNDYYFDLDIVNCHPVLLVQFVKNKLNIDLKHLKYYVDNRAECLKNISEDREEAKTEIIKIIYGSKIKSGSSLFVKDLSKELFDISKLLSEFEEYKELFDYCKMEKGKLIDGSLVIGSIYGSFLSYIIQTEERKCMLSMKEYLEEDKHSVDVLTYDGVMVRKTKEQINNNTSTFDINIISKLESYIKDKTTYDVNIVQKPFQMFVLPPVVLESRGIYDTKEYIEMKRDFEDNHFYFVPSNSYAENNTTYGLAYYNYSHAQTYFSINWRFKYKDEIKQFFPIWNEDEKRKIIMEINMQPSSNPLCYSPPLNLKYTTTDYVKDDNVLSLFDNLMTITTGNNDVLKEYFTKWLAHILQQPFDLPGVAIILTGLKGIGKDTIANFIMNNILGSNYAFNYDSNEQFFEKHDVGRQNKLLIKLEEADRSLCTQNASALKTKITASTMVVNIKGISPFSIANYNRFIFTTNKPNPVDMSDDERRFVIIPCSSEKKGDSVYWTNIYKNLLNDRGGRIIAEYLLGVDLSGFDPRILPFNSYQQEVSQEELPVDELFLKQWDGNKITATNLFTDYRLFCSENHYRGCQTSTSFGRMLLKYIRDGVLFKSRSATTVFYSKQ